jgi:hypothetical protein
MIMRRLRFTAAVLSIPLLGSFMLGCGSSEDSTRDMPPSSKVAKRSSGSGTKDKVAEGGGGGAGGGSGGGGGAAGASELESTGSGTLKGIVTFDGTPPAQTPVKMEKDPEYCRKTDPKKLQVWDVGPNKGVANVIVWLRAPKGKCFKIPDDMKQWKGDSIKIDQPHCAFEPRVVALFPSYFDAKTKKQTETGQKFLVLNDATIPHNTNWTPSSTLLNSGGNSLLPPKGEKVSKLDMVFKPSKPTEAGGEQTITFACNIHPWMKGYAKVFDHPFEVVTKEDGVFEIKNAPAGVELDLVYWHESMNAPQVLEKITLKDKETLTKEIKVK